MALLTQYTSFFVSPFGEQSVTDELNIFLRSHRIVNVGWSGHVVFGRTTPPFGHPSAGGEFPGRLLFYV